LDLPFVVGDVVVVVVVVAVVAVVGSVVVGEVRRVGVCVDVTSTVMGRRQPRS
jgi:hypothetical protein